MVNSHIQLPKFILKRFRGTDGKVRYLTLSDLMLHSSGVKNLGTEQGYYSEDMEKYLNREVENAYSKLVDKVARFTEKKQDSFTITARDEGAWKNV